MSAAWTLHHGDCIAGLATLADASVDVTITDPPYEAEAHELGKRQNPMRDGHARVVDDGISFAAITDKQRTAVAEHIARITRNCAVVFCQIEAVTAWRAAFNAAGMPYRRAIPWVKPDAMPSLHGRWPGQSFETIVVAQHKSARTPPVGGKAVSYTSTRDASAHSPQGTPHPTTKPLRLMRALVDDFSEIGDLILDPFAGSGTTGIAAIMAGRRFIGWELDAEYHAIACRRLRGDEAKPNAAQPSLFGGVA